MSIINPKRQPDESYVEYCARRAYMNKQLKDYLKGRLIWKSCEPVEVKDPETGQVVDVVIAPVQGTYRKKEKKNV